MRTTTVHALRVLQRCCGELVGLYTEQAELVDQLSATDPVEWITAELLVIRARLEKAKHECRSLKILLRGIDIADQDEPMSAEGRECRSQKAMHEAHRIGLKTKEEP